MTETDWAECADPRPMLAFLHGRATDRQLRLFACACARGVWRFVPPGPCRDAVAVSLRFADGLATAEEMAGARAAAVAAAGRSDSRAAAAWSACETTDPSAARAARASSDEAREQIREHSPPAAEAEGVDQAALLRDIVGDPFRKTWAAPLRRLGRHPEVRDLAECLYDAPDDMDVLADKLQRRGCSSEAVLSHCRGDGPHAVGCWVLTAILGKERGEEEPAGAGAAREILARVFGDTPRSADSSAGMSAVRAALARHLGDKKFRRLVRRVLAAGRGRVTDGRVHLAWEDFARFHPEHEAAGGMEEVCRVCPVHRCEVSDPPGDPPGWVGRWAWGSRDLEARGTMFPCANLPRAAGWPACETGGWWCPDCQRAWEEWAAANARPVFG